MADDVIMLSYNDAAKKMGIKPDSVRRRARNRKWHRTKGNDGTTLVAIPSELIPPDDLGVIGGDKEDKKEIKKDIRIAVLESENGMMKEAITELKADRDAWRKQAQKRSWWPFFR